MRTFQFSDAKSHKFWSIDVNGNAFTVTYGKVGATGQTQTKTFADAATAQAEADKLIREKTKKGYTETTPKASASPAEAFEAALKANPDDFAGWCAFADYLVEQGEPRGAFMQTQIALEDESRPKDERDALKKREAELLKKHKAEWVGEWADLPEVGDSTDEWVAPEGWVPYRFTRGVLTDVELGNLSVDVARAVVKAPQLGFVRNLIVHDIAFQEEGEYEEGPDTAGADAGAEDVAQHVLVRWPQLRYIRSFKFGGCEPHEYSTDWCPYRSHAPGALVADFVKQMADIEELHIMAHFTEVAERLVALPMPKLRTLLLYHGWCYPLDKLAKNPTLTNLRELYCHPHALEAGSDPYIRLPQLRAVCKSQILTGLTHLQLRLADFGDEGVSEIIKSGLLKRLRVLDLRHGLVTDDGAEALAASPDLKNLTRLDLSWNRLTAKGVAALTGTGVPVTLLGQQGPNAETWETFGQGDIE